MLAGKWNDLLFPYVFVCMCVSVSPGLWRGRSFSKRGQLRESIRVLGESFVMVCDRFVLEAVAHNRSSSSPIVAAMGSRKHE